MPQMAAVPPAPAADKVGPLFLRCLSLWSLHIDCSSPTQRPPPSKPFFQDPHHTPTTPVPRPLTPLLHDFLYQSKPPPLLLNPKISLPLSTEHDAVLEKHRDPNKGKLWSHHRLSPQGEFILQFLIDPQFNIEKLDEILLNLCNSCDEEMGSSKLSIETTCFDVLGIIKALGYYKKCDMALKVFEWVRNCPDSDKLVNGSAVAVIISMLGKEGQVSAAASFFHNLHNDGFGIDVYAYTSLITVFASNRRYREVVMVFKKMEEDGCKLTLISINGEGLVADCDGFPTTFRIYLYFCKD
ncbi:Pentatricopeptide repeat-containing protein [Abeliophyllum distichum]|uniref:Pentatricopeptide repeat-containing protein n=1 Tax=Abeliophyllum distichum TaxID=126358 RepID=A0ABD1PNW4_9LAMI